MGVIVLKIILLIAMAVVALVAGTIPMKVYDYLKKRSKAGGHSSLIISLLSCFAGGVILGVCLLDMFPDAQEDSKNLKNDKIWKDYPFLELFVGIGFFIVYFLEEIIDRMCVHDHEIERERRMTVNFTPGELQNPDNSSTSSNGRTQDYESGNSSNPKLPDYGSTYSNRPLAATECSVEKMEEHDPVGKKKNIVSAFTFVLALMIHTFLEGFAFGVQDTEVSVTSLFFGIIVHKALVMFSVGMSLIEKLPDKKILIFIFISVLALVSPLGGAIGMAIEESDIAEKPKTIIITILTCFSIGCFFFITFFDILAVERKNQHNNLLQWIACVLGFICVGVIILLEGGDDDDSTTSTPTPCLPQALTEALKSF